MPELRTSREAVPSAQVMREMPLAGWLLSALERPSGLNEARVDAVFEVQKNTRTLGLRRMHVVTCEVAEALEQLEAMHVFSSSGNSSHSSRWFTVVHMNLKFVALGFGDQANSALWRELRAETWERLRVADAQLRRDAAPCERHMRRECETFRSPPPPQRPTDQSLC